jgi:hypothetical protein
MCLFKTRELRDLFVTSTHHLKTSGVSQQPAPFFARSPPLPSPPGLSRPTRSSSPGAEVAAAGAGVKKVRNLPHLCVEARRISAAQTPEICRSRAREEQEGARSHERRPVPHSTMSGSGEQMLVALKLSKASNLGEVVSACAR